MTETIEQTIARLASTHTPATLRRYARVSRWNANELRTKGEPSHKVQYWDEMVHIYTCAAIEASK